MLYRYGRNENNDVSHFDVRERERERERREREKESERYKPGKEQEGNNEERRHNSCARSKVSRGQFVGEIAKQKVHLNERRLRFFTSSLVPPRVSIIVLDFSIDLKIHSLPFFLL